MPKHLALKLLLITIVPLTACKAWYKAGADETDLTLDQQRCTDQTRASTGKVFVECMERAGWHHTNMSAAVNESESASPSVAEVEVTPATIQRHNTAPDKTIATKAGAPETTHTTESPDGTEKPAELRHVGGWVQFGADTERLRDARAQCNKSGVGSETFNECMQNKGWRPIGIRISVEEPGDLD